MSVTVTSPISAGYVPNGATRAFAFNFKAASTAEIAVYRVLAGVATLISPSAYSVVLAAGEGGTVTFTVAPVAGTGTIYIVSAPLLTQTLALANDGPFTPSILNGALDRAAIRAIFLNFQANRSLKVPLNETDPGYPDAADRANNYLTHDGAGKPIPGISTSGVNQMLSDISTNALAIANEATTRGNADTAETTARVAADNGLAASIATEAGARVTADNAEAATRASADAAEATARANAVSGEATTRAAGDAALGARIDGETAGRSSADAAILTAIQNAGGTLSNVTINAADRTILAALNHTLGLPAWLAEPGREGTFYPVLTDVSAFVTADALNGNFGQGIYVPFASDPTGASGAWVRRNSWVWNVQWFGCVGDAFAAGTGTDNVLGLNAAIALGSLLPCCEIVFPAAKGHYRFASQPSEFTSGIKVTGQGWHENSGTVNGVSFAFPKNYTGSVCRFEADVKGFTASAYTNRLANAQVAQFQSANNFIISDIMLLSMGGVGITAHGLDLYVATRATGVRVTGFAGNGFNFAANTAGALRYGNTDLSQLIGCTADANKLHAWYADGNDNNVIRTVGCSFRNNGGAAVLDTTIVGTNGFYNCQAATNNRSHPTNSSSGFSAAQIAKVQADAPCLTDNLTGAFIQYRGKDYSGNDVGNLDAFICCYSEGGGGGKSRLRAPTDVSGGTIGQIASRHSEWTAQTRNGNELINVVNFTNINQGQFVFNDGAMVLKFNSGTSIPQFTITPFGASFSRLAMQGLSGSATQGLDIVAGNASAYFSADTIVMRNAAQSNTYATIDATGINIAATTPQLKISGTKVVGVRQTGTPAAATDLATALTLVNDLRTKLIAHGLIS